jgi:hypothetical protein
VTEFEQVMRQGGAAAIRAAARFFMHDDPVHQTLHEIARRLDALHIPYAIVGGMALVAHGYARTTVDVDLLVTGDGLQTAHQALDGLGYTRLFAGSKSLRDTQTGVCVEFLVTGQYPGDGRPKPVSFPDPAAASVEIDGLRFVNLPTLIELKLAAGMTHPGRLRDLADVQELIRALRLPADFGEQLNPYVRHKFAELWRGVTTDDPPSGP